MDSLKQSTLRQMRIANVTRTTRLLDSATSESEIKYANEKIASLNARIETLLGIVPKQITQQAAV